MATKIRLLFKLIFTLTKQIKSIPCQVFSLGTLVSKEPALNLRRLFIFDRQYVTITVSSAGLQCHLKALCVLVAQSHILLKR